MRMSKLFGLVGRKGSGKDTLAREVERIGKLSSLNPVHITHFADPLKNICCNITSLPRDAFFNPENKEKTLDFPIELDDYVSRLSIETALNIQKRGLVATTPREILQYIGTDYVRSVDKDYWTDCLKEYVQSYLEDGFIVIVADVRYQNEADVIKELGGVNIKINRPEKPISADNHSSESTVDEIKTDASVTFMENDYERHTATAKSMIELTRKIDAENSLFDIVEGFNNQLSAWSLAHDFGVNFEWRYAPNGDKYLSVKDYFPTPEKPSAEELLEAMEELKKVCDEP